jgi:hypothetical protein
MGLCFIACNTKVCESNETHCELGKGKEVEAKSQDFPPSVKCPLEEIFLFSSSN